MSAEPQIGGSVRRREDPPLLTGNGRYASDLRLPGLCHLAVVRGSLAHARILSVNVEPARRLPGVVAAWSPGDLPELRGPMNDVPPPGVLQRPRPVLATGEVRHVGEAVAVVVARDPYVAADAAQTVAVELEPLPAVAGVLEASAASAPRVHADLPGNLAGRTERAFGDVDAAFGERATVVRQRFHLARVAGGYLEPRAATASLDGAGRLVVWTSTQWVFGVHASIAAALGLDHGQLRVLAQDVGGGFGAKGMPYPEEVLVALAARRLGRPVSWVASRSEDTVASAHSHGTVLDLELAAEADGSLRGLRGRVLHDVGAYTASGAGQSDNIVSHLVSAYRLPALRIEVDLVLTNAAPCGFIRGGGREVGNFGIERLLDLLASRLRLDPVELRRRNLIAPRDMPHDTGYPERGGTVVYDGGDYPHLLELALEAVGYQEVRRSQAKGWRPGVGVACCVESTGLPAPETARVHLAPHGRVNVLVGSTPHGQGHQTIAAQVVADRLGWPSSQITVTAGDTAAVPFAAVTAASRSAVDMGNAVARAALAARRRLLEMAAEALEASPEDVVLTADGAHVRGVPERLLPLAEVVGPEGLEVMETLEADRRRAYASSCHAALVEVDPDTGDVAVSKYVIVHDVGRPINPLLVEGQMHGGFAHGLGYGLFEEAHYEPDGAFRSASFLDYAIPSAPEVGAGPILRHITTASLHNPEGFKGAGEGGTIAVPAALANAVEDALRRHGSAAVVDRLPITPELVLKLLR
jgi:carbon-monoxide dehydrogenase large subunit